MEALYKYHGYTLIDITHDNSADRNQQRNWETVNQILSMRAQLLEFNYLGVISDEISKYSFGADYTGTHRIWQFSFAIDRDDVYNIACDRYGVLKNDFAVTPVILGLTETAQPSIPLFFASGREKNIYIIAQ